MSVISRTCTACKTEKPAADFTPNRNGVNGLRSRCKACETARRQRAKQADPEGFKRRIHASYLRRREKCNEQSRQWHEANREKANAARRERYQRHAEREKENARVRRRKCPERVAATTKAWVDANRERYRATRRRWAKTNPESGRTTSRQRRARKAAAEGDHTAAEVKALFKRQKGKCAVCRQDISTGYHADHRVPLSKGGSNAIQNIDLLCPPCNLSKGTKLPEDFRREHGLLL